MCKFGKNLEKFTMIFSRFTATFTKHHRCSPGELQLPRSPHGGSPGAWGMAPSRASSLATPEHAEPGSSRVFGLPWSHRPPLPLLWGVVEEEKIGKPTRCHGKNQVEPEFAIDLSMSFREINQAHPVLKILWALVHVQMLHTVRTQSSFYLAATRVGRLSLFGSLWKGT